MTSTFRSSLVASATAAAILLAACRASSRATTAPTPGLDGTPFRAPKIGDAAYHYTVFFRRPTDSTERRLAAVDRTESTSDNGASATFTVTWSAPYDTRDTLRVRMRDLAPTTESLFAGGKRYLYQYDGHRVTGRVPMPDSTTGPFDQTFLSAPYAFNEVELVVRSLDYTPGLQVVLPFFSEIDKAIEHDTLTVTGRGALASGDSTWLIRFGDPAIVTIYTVNARTREIEDASTENRRSHGIFHYVRVKP